MPLDFLPSKVDSITLVTLRGMILAGEAVELLLSKTKQLLEAGETRIILDLAEVKFVDSTGIAALVKLSSAAKQKGGCLKLLRLTKRIRDVLQITRLGPVLGIYDDLEQAIASFGAKPQPSASGKPPP